MIATPSEITGARCTSDQHLDTWQGQDRISVIIICISCAYFESEGSAVREMGWNRNWGWLAMPADAFEVLVWLQVRSRAVTVGEVGEVLSCVSQCSDGFSQNVIACKRRTDLHMSPWREFCQLYFEPSVVQGRRVCQNDPNCGCLGGCLQKSIEFKSARNFHLKLSN